ncbi:hypothetical protein RHSIM_Rhsim01G0090100 [Rhododendron simsii]|uniref:Uncharacterized protein n=1 Tax=Rhododendron simsii TaxID=118357 RepID=A0A834LUT4_RHOSS|nr:hypothetical protein RHSIM_Rhsim01G0090100 [Rhododendron simsii]
MSVLIIPEVVEDPYLWMTTGEKRWYEMGKCNAGDKCMISHKCHHTHLLVARGLRVNSEFVDFCGKAEELILIYPGKEPRQDAISVNEWLPTSTNKNAVGFTNSFVISVNGSKFYLHIHKVSSGTFILVYGENIEENRRMGLLTQLRTCKLYGPMRDLVLRANGGGEYTDKSEEGCRLHLNYCFVARDDTILMECIDFIGNDIEVWDISIIDKEWIKSSSQGLRTSKEETNEKGDYDYYAFLLKDDIGCFVSSSFLPVDRDDNEQLEDNFVFNHLVAFLKKVVDAVKSMHDSPVESLGFDPKKAIRRGVPNLSITSAFCTYWNGKDQISILLVKAFLYQISLPNFGSIVY